MPVSLLCGFLGAGKTTLLKHVLESKHEEEDFKCAVIVNDMAALNIDKALIDQSALVQSDEVIAMQNGCFCCTLQNDLVEQIISLAEKKVFNYMLIEASGVSEPSQIAPLFELCTDEHDHEAEHKEGPELGDVARLDTCVTVVDAAEFYNNLESMKVRMYLINLLSTRIAIFFKRRINKDLINYTSAFVLYRLMTKVKSKVPLLSS